MLPHEDLAKDGATRRTLPYTGALATPQSIRKTRRAFQGYILGPKFAFYTEMTTASTLESIRATSAYSGILLSFVSSACLATTRRDWAPQKCRVTSICWLWMGMVHPTMQLFGSSCPRVSCSWWNTVAEWHLTCSTILCSAPASTMFQRMFDNSSPTYSGAKITTPSPRGLPNELMS